MKIRIGTSRLFEWLEYTSRLAPQFRDALMPLAESKLGVEFEPKAIKAQYTRHQECGFHYLINQWMKRDKRITVDQETFKSQLLMACFGAAVTYGYDGQESLVPVRRTTQEWDHEENGYVRKKISRELYTQLIEFVYRMAAEDSIVLPELKAEMRGAA